MCEGRCCSCQTENRLCNPNLCKKCESKCSNTIDLISNGYKFRLVIGISSIHGWGLFALHDIPDGSFIREYIGEYLLDEDQIAEREESVIKKPTYFFFLAESATIDSMFMGNKTRFCNHSSIYDNVIVRIINDSGIYRICLFAKRNIKKYEELLFDYQIGEQKNKLKKEIYTNTNDESVNNLQEIDRYKVKNNRIIQARSNLHLDLRFKEFKRSKNDTKIITSNDKKIKESAITDMSIICIDLKEKL